MLADVRSARLSVASGSSRLSGAAREGRGVSECGAARCAGGPRRGRADAPGSAPRRGPDLPPGRRRRRNGRLRPTYECRRPAAWSDPGWSRRSTGCSTCGSAQSSRRPARARPRRWPTGRGRRRRRAVVAGGPRHHRPGRGRPAPAVGAALRPLGRAAARRSRASRTSTTALDDHPGPVAVVLDDFHHVATDRVGALLERLLLATGDHVHLVIGSRVLPPLNLARSEVASHVVGPSDLRFRPVEVAELFRAEYRIPISAGGRTCAGPQHRGLGRCPAPGPPRCRRSWAARPPPRARRPRRRRELRAGLPHPHLPRRPRHRRPGVPATDGALRGAGRRLLRPAPRADRQ